MRGLTEQFSDSIARNRTRRNLVPSSRALQRPLRSSRTRKRSKRLDAISDRVIEPVHQSSEVLESSAAKQEPLRRSSRLSGLPLFSATSLSLTSNQKYSTIPTKTGKKKEDPAELDKQDPHASHARGDQREEFENWRSRLRSRTNEVTVSPRKDKSKRKPFQKPDIFNEEQKPSKSRKLSNSDEKSYANINTSGCLPDNKEETSGSALKEDPSTLSTGKVILSFKEKNNKIEDRKGISNTLEFEAEPSNNSANQYVTTNSDLLKQSPDELVKEIDIGVAGDSVKGADKRKGDCEGRRDDNLGKPHAHTGLGTIKSGLKEGRRCGLCGGGSDGKPPRKLICDSAWSDNDADDRVSASDEPNYNKWDGFGDEPGWLGPLLGPIHDRYGIAGVWVHQLCAVWSPEVYFAGLGRLKNVRTALCRGRALKCSRCGRPGATIGCRVDRCPRTYHLSCARVEGSIFDHRKFLIACSDHRFLFQPHGYQYFRWITKLKARRLKLEMRKLAQDSSRRDLEAEEKWLENFGEDEEFLKREGRRLHRDLCRIAPVYIGGDRSGASDESYEGFESVAGLESVVQCMKEVVILPLLYPEFFSTLGLTPPRGVLLHGYPGTGKTLVVRALIGDCARGNKRIAYFARKGADCLGKYVGDAERQLRLLFQVAEKSQPSIIFFDEIDGLAPKRSKHQDQTHCSVVSTLLALLDGLKSRGSVIVIGATNRPDSLDPALRRPGRFDREIHFPLPSLKDRASILSLHTQKWPKPLSGTLKHWLAEKTAGFGGADLQALCTQAALVALKRNCPLQELLTTAERYPGPSKKIPAPHFMVEEQDWLAALTSVPPPCSRRDASMTANDVNSWPLHTHLIPCLLYPVSNILVSLYLDEQIWLPPLIYKAGKLLKDIIYSALEKKKLPFSSWEVCFHDLVQEPDILKALERSLSQTGLLRGPPTFQSSEYVCNDGSGNFGSGLTGLSKDGFYYGETLSQEISVSPCMTLGFRMLVAGNARSGQRHVAACLLHGFVGHIVTQKIDLATISQEGSGDLVQGVTCILLKCANIGRCILYMPRIDLWAMDKDHDEDHSDLRLCSDAWSSFVEQVDSMGSSVSLVILATCDAPVETLPYKAKAFFMSTLPNYSGSASSEPARSRFVVELDGQFTSDMAINVSSKILSQDLFKQYVSVIHYIVHASNRCSKVKSSDSIIIDSEDDTHAGQSEETNKATEKEQKNMMSVSVPGLPERKVDLHLDQDSVFPFSSNRSSKEKCSFLVAAFGYQILHYPHFAELCWATSKLKRGPCTGINGPWKGWPFNSCIIRPSNSACKSYVGVKNNDIPVVRGLVAVGLLACRGAYISVVDVTLDIRKVLELLVEEIRNKIAAGKDKHRFLRLLSQAAYLEDAVNCWAYKLRSYEESQGIARHGSTPEGMNLNDCKGDVLARSDDNNSSGSDKPKSLLQDSLIRSPVGEGGRSCNIARDPHVYMTVENVSSQDVKATQELCSISAHCPAVPYSDRSNSQGHPHSHGHTKYSGGDLIHRVVSPNTEYPPSVKGPHFAHDSLSSPDSGVQAFEGDRQIGSTNLAYCSVGSEAKSSGQILEENRLSSVENVSNNGKFVAKRTTSTTEENKDSCRPEDLCVYRCCSECIHRILMLVEEMMVRNLKSNGGYCNVDDVHDVVETCSARLLTTVSRHIVSRNCRNIDEFINEHAKASGCQIVGDACHKNNFTNIGAMPLECICHSKSINPQSDQMELSCFFRGCMLLPSDSENQAFLHCKFEQLCLCSVIGKILAIQQ